MGPPVIRFHPEAVSVDLFKLSAVFEPNEYFELLAQINRAVREVASGRIVPQRDMEPPYKGWTRKKFHSNLHPPQNVSADMRLIYQFDDSGSILHILAVGYRLPGDPNDIYAATTSRKKSF